MPELRRQLKDVVIIFNKLEDAEARNVSLFLHQVYGRIFKAVVVFGPLPVPELGIEGAMKHQVQQGAECSQYVERRLGLLWGNRSGGVLIGVAVDDACTWMRHWLFSPAPGLVLERLRWNLPAWVCHVQDECRITGATAVEVAMRMPCSRVPAPMSGLGASLQVSVHRPGPSRDLLTYNPSQ